MFLNNLILFLVAYLIGSLSFGNIISKIFFHNDITAMGSKSAGATNIKRTYGWKVSIAVMFLDTFKVYGYLWICALIMEHVNFFHSANFFVISIGALLGHAFPLYFKFHGGKGASVIYAILAFYNPIFFLVTAFLWWLIFLITKYSSLSSLLSIPIASLIIILSMCFNAPFIGRSFIETHIYLDLVQNISISIVALILENIIIIFLHKENILRLINKQELKIKI